MKTTRSLALAALFCVAMLLQAGTAHANKCSAGKVKCVVNKTKALLGCYSKAAGKGLTVDAACIQKAQDKFDGGADPTKGCFEKLEAKGEKAGAKPDSICPTSNDTAAIEAKIDAFVADLADDVDTVAGANKCAAGKQKCIATKAGGLLGCYNKSLGKDLTVDAACLQKATAKFDGGAVPAGGCFEKLEAKGEKAGAKPDAVCPTTDDTAAVEAKVDAFVDDVVCDVAPNSPGCVAATPTPTTTPTATATPCGAPNTCGNCTLDAGEFCEAGVAGGTCGDGFTCTNCNCACPSKVTFVGESDPTSILDTGWTGISHRAPVITNGNVTVGLSCVATSRPCGVCNITGPVPNTEPNQLANRRCNNDTSTKCTSSGDCSGGGTCEFFFGAPLPLAAGGVTTCVVNQFNGTVTGTANVESGEASTTALLRSSVFNGLAIDNPCARCSDTGGINDGVAGGTCIGGTRDGQPCDANGEVIGRPDFGRTSLDCPLAQSAFISALSIDLSNETRTVTRTLSANSPSCTENGFTNDKCLCDTCNNASAEPCMTNADCPLSGGNPGICGGRRCLSGPNNGAPCTTGTQCPSGACSRPGGKPSAPSACSDDTTVTDRVQECADDDGDGEGACTIGPNDQNCTVASGHAQRGCTTDADCGGASGSCASAPRGCFLTGGGTFQASGTSDGSDTLIAVGMNDLPVSDVSHPTLGAVFCVSPTALPAINQVAGLPGPARVTIKGTARGLQ